MSDRLLIRLATDGRFSWVTSAALESVSEGVPAPQILANAQEIIVFVPAQDVLLTQVQLITRTRAQLEKALPYALEDQLLSPIEELHFSFVKTLDSSIAVAVVAKKCLRGWLDQLAAIGIDPDILIPETVAMPVTLSIPSIVLEDKQAIVRLNSWSAFVCEINQLETCLASLGSTLSFPSLEIFDYRNKAEAMPLLQWKTQYQRQPGGVLGLLARGVDEQIGFNLLTGEFAPQHRRKRGVQRWRIAAVLAVVTLALVFLVSGMETWMLSRQAMQIDAQLLDIVHKTFPDVGSAELERMSPQMLLQGRLERLRGGSDANDVLRLLQQIAPVLGSNTRFQTQGMEYHNGVLELALRVPDVATLDSLRERVATLPGVKAEVTGANPGADGVDGRIRISAGVP